jgi:hypothetical protein
MLFQSAGFSSIAPFTLGQVENCGITVLLYSGPELQ